MIQFAQKDRIGNDPCDQPCPEHSMIPRNFVGGAKGEENCLCVEGYVQMANYETFEFWCEEATNTSDESYKTFAMVPAVIFTFAMDNVQPAEFLKEKAHFRW